MSSKKIVSEAYGVFSLPWLVARDHKLFEAEGVEVEVVENLETAKQTASANPTIISDHNLVSALTGHSGLDTKEIDVYRACEWGQVRRSQDHRDGRVISKRAAVVSQAIFSAPGSPYTYPQALRNKPVAVRFHHGSHYAALQALEGFLERDEINLVHLDHTNGFEAVRRGEIAAVTLMEPWITIAEKLGFQRVVETHYIGLEIASPGVSPESWAAVNRAIKKAVAIINQDKRAVLHHLLNVVPPQYANLITVDDFHLPRIRFVDPEPYSAEEFQHTYDWLVSWGLIAPNDSFDRLVDNRLKAEVAA